MCQVRGYSLPCVVIAKKNGLKSNSWNVRQTVFYADTYTFGWLFQICRVSVL